MSYTICRLEKVRNQTGLSRSSIYLRIANGTFPKQINLGDRAVGWLADDIDKWIEERIAASRMDDQS